MLKEKFGSRQQLLKVNSFLFSCRGKPSQCFMSDGLIQVYLKEMKIISIGSSSPLPI